MKPYFTDSSGDVVLYHGDSREVLGCLADEAAQLIVTDPPYSMTYTNEAGKGLRGDAQRQGIRLYRSCLMELDRVLAPNSHVYSFCHWESWPDFYDAVASYWNTKNALIWSKGNFGPGDCEGDYAHDYEMILFAHKGRRLLNGGRDLAVREHATVSGHQRTHPTEKPSSLLEFLIGKSSMPGETVLDPFCGTGSTLRAAKDLGRKAIGIEVHEQFCEAAARRLQQEALPYG